MQIAFSDPDASYDELHATLDRFGSVTSARPVLCDAGGPERVANPGRGGEDASLRLNGSRWRMLVDGVARAADAARERGFEPVFHHHTSTYVESVEEIDRFLEETDVPLLLDSGHLLVAGGDPLQALADWGDRIDAIHVKDVRLDVLAGVKAERADTLTAWRRGLFCALGAGDVDLAAFCAARGRDRLRRLGRRRAGPRARRSRRLRQRGRRSGQQPRMAAGARGMVNVGVIGAGLMGSTHARLLATAVSGADVVAISDALPESAARVAEELGVPMTHADGLELIANPAVDAVVVASPAATHEPFTLACLAAGKPVLCEKPLAVSAAAALRIVEAEAATGRRLVTVGFMRRYDPGYADLKARLDAGQIGAPLLVHSAHRNPSVHSFFDSAMIITDTAVHEIDITRWLLGDEITRVTVLSPRATSRAREGLRDPLLILLETAGGQIVDVEAFVSAGYAYDIRCEIVGEDGTLELLAAGDRVLARGAFRVARDPAGLPVALRGRVPQRAAGLDRRDRARRGAGRPERVGRLRRGGGLRSGRRVASNQAAPST